MKEDKFHRWIKKEIEEEAEALEKHAQENEELASLRMPDDSYEDLMRRIAAQEKEKAGKAAEKASGAGRAGTGGARIFHFRRRTLIAAALAAVLLLALGAGAVGERLFEPEVTGQIEDGEYNVRVESGDETYYLNLDETEAYEEIEERLGILALRLGYKPKGMELTKVVISEDMGEARMEFCYKDSILRIYGNKQSSSAVFDSQIDGKIVDVVEMFHNEEKLSILEVEGDEIASFYTVQIRYGNAYYRVTSGINLKEFKEVVKSISFADI